MSDTPTSYLALRDVTVVVSASGRPIGTLRHVLQDDRLDFIDGIVLGTSGTPRFVDADQIERITASEVRTTLSVEEVERLPAPDGEAVHDAAVEPDAGPGLTAWFDGLFGREH